LADEAPAAPAAAPQPKALRKKERLAVDRRKILNPPAHLRCQIDGKLAVHPVRSPPRPAYPEGVLFERTSILKWISSVGSVCPVTQAPLRPEELVQADDVKREVIAWVKSMQAERTAA
jgi:hypothetical protein